MGKFSNSWELMKASWNILKLDKEMLVFPLLSAISAIIVTLSFVTPLFLMENGAVFSGLVESENKVPVYLLLFLFYFCNYLVMIFFNSAIVICATIRMNGGDPTVADGLRLAFKRLPLIAGWAVVASSVGMILRMIEERVGIIGRIITALIGMAWTVTSFLVIPIMVVDKRGPIEALKESAHLLRKTWGEQLISNFSFGLIFILLGIPAVVLIILGAMSGEVTLIITFVVIAAIYLIILALIQSTLQGLFQAALFKYARSGSVPEGFDSQLLKGAIRVK